MQVDAHTHILSLGSDAEFTAEYGSEGSLCIYRSLGLLPSHRCPTEHEWEKATGASQEGFLPLREKLSTVNEEAVPLGLPPIPQHKIDGIMGDSLARVLGLVEDSA